MRRPIEQRFWFDDKVEFTERCWLWTGRCDRDGYGLFGAKGRNQQAHRISFELSFGPIPSGKIVEHECRNKSCVKPAHLRAATQKENLENLSGAYANSKSGIRGVHWHKRANKWVVTVNHYGNTYSGGAFRDLSHAEAAAIALRNSLYTHNEVDRAASLEVAA